MMKSILLASLLTTACVADIGAPDPTVETSAKTGAGADPDKHPLPPTPVPEIVEMAWHWSGCNPAADNLLPFGITVDVFVDDGTGVIQSCTQPTAGTDPATCAIAIKGLVDNCDSFSASGQFSPCKGFAAANVATRNLDVQATDANGYSNEASTPVTDCVDGKWTAFDPPKT